MTRRPLLLLAAALLAVFLLDLLVADALPNRYGHSDREERHLFPAVTTGPIDQIYRYDVDEAGNTATHVTRGIQPSVSPDGSRLAYVGRGGLRILNLDTGESGLIRAEETAFRMRPQWTPDGQSILYVTDERGSNDVRIISAEGGRPIELTADDENHELSPIHAGPGMVIGGHPPPRPPPGSVGPDP